MAILDTASRARSYIRIARLELDAGVSSRDELLADFRAWVELFERPARNAEVAAIHADNRKIFLDAIAEVMP